MQSRSQNIDILPAHHVCYLGAESAAYVVSARGYELFLCFVGQTLAAEILDASIQFLEAEVDLALAEDGLQGCIDLLPRLLEEEIRVHLAGRPEVLDQQLLRPRVDVVVRRGPALGVALPARSRRAPVGAGGDVHHVGVGRHGCLLARKVVHAGGAHRGRRVWCRRWRLDGLARAAWRAIKLGALARRREGRGAAGLLLGGEKVPDRLARVLPFPVAGRRGHWWDWRAKAGMTSCGCSNAGGHSLRPWAEVLP